MVKNLKLLRNQKGISQQTLASEIGISQQSVNKYENHNIEPDINTLISLADYFDTTVDYLIGRTENGNFINGSCSNTNKIKGYEELNQKQKDCIKTLIDTFNSSNNK